jgi:hypothetical protein
LPRPLREETRKGERDGQARKRKERKTIEVTADFYNSELVKAKSSLDLCVYKYGERIGRLKVGRGGIFWYSRYKVKPIRLNWDQFIDRIEDVYGRNA